VNDFLVKKIVQLVPSFLLLAVSTSGQQVASLDLTRPAQVAEIPKSAQEPESVGGCEKTSMGTIVDGFTQSDDKQPRPIRVAFIDVSSLKLQIGSELEATVQLLNSGKSAIEIPWSTDWETTIAGQDPSSRNWTVGMFEVHLRGKGRHAELKGLSQILYGSQFVPGSSLTLRLGESITSRIKFSVEVAHPAWQEIDAGGAELSAVWFQTTPTRVEKDCRVSLGYFPFKSYEQENPPVTVQVEKSELEEGKKAESQPK
jgi:hypothetical protein